MHLQHEPHQEIKLVRCIRGSVYDVIVDLRIDSPTFLKWFGVELSEKNRKLIYIPEGFAHGFQTLQENSELLYHHTEYYNPQSEGGLNYLDPIIGIEWPLPVSLISDRDQNLPMFKSNNL
jgi:dTDP-4-dehydrorhamnose 3,5-epimerase